MPPPRATAAGRRLVDAETGPRSARSAVAISASPASAVGSTAGEPPSR